MIQRIAIEHFKSIDNLDLELGPLTVIVGPNGSGKSNFVDALRLIRDSADKGLDYAISERHGIDSIRQWSPSRPYNISFAVEFDSDRRRLERGKFSFTLSSAKGQHRVRRESAAWTHRAPHFRSGETRRTRFRYERDATGSIKINSKTMKFRSPEDELYLETRFFGPSFNTRILQQILGNIETYSIFPNTLRMPQKPTTDSRLSSDGANLTSVFKALSKSRRATRDREEILGALRKVMPNLESIRIHSLGGLMVPTFRVQEADERRHDFNVSQISDGTLHLLGLLTALYQPNRPAVIAMEEPEQTVNPGVLPVLADAFREVSSQGTQIIITTHSPHLVDLFEPEEIRTAELIDGKTVIQPINPAQKKAVQDRLFSLGELMTIEGLHG